MAFDIRIFEYMFFFSRQLNLLCKIKWARNCRLQAATAGAVICRQIYRCCCDWINAECMKRQRHIQTAQTLQSRNSKVVSSICSAKISMSNLFYICMAKPTNFNIHAKLLWTAKNFKLDCARKINDSHHVLRIHLHSANLAKMYKNCTHSFFHIQNKIATNWSGICFERRECTSPPLKNSGRSNPVY